MDVRRISVNKNDVKKHFVTKASDNHKSATYLTGVYTPICSPTRYGLICQNSLYLIKERQ